MRLCTDIFRGKVKQPAYNMSVSPRWSGSSYYIKRMAVQLDRCVSPLSLPEQTDRNEEKYEMGLCKPVECLRSVSGTPVENLGNAEP